MSANGPGQFGGYTPPPPPPSSKKSPWLWVGLGCGALMLLTFGGCVAIGLYVKNAASAPVDVAAVKQGLGDTPEYPGSKLDETFTKAGRFVSLAMKAVVHADTAVVAGYETQDPMSKVFDFYETALKKQGYKQVPSKNQQVDMFEKSQDAVAIQPAGGATRTGNTIFWVMRFHGPNVKVDDN